MEATDTVVGMREKVLWRMLHETAAHAEEILTLDVGDLDTAIRRARVRSKGGSIEYVRLGEETSARITAEYDPYRRR